MKKLIFNIGNKTIGDGGILIQSMSDRKTSLIEENISLTNSLEELSLDMMRFSILDEDDLNALIEIKKKVNIPIIADIHYNYLYAIKAMKNHADKVRINPGNIGSESNLREVIKTAKEMNIPLRIGVNSGSLNKYKGKTSSKIDDYLLALDETLEIFKQENFEKIVLSLKSSDVDMTTQLYRRAYEKYPYPLHIGLTEAGRALEGAIKSTVALFPLLKDGIGDTIRVSLAEKREYEIRACKTLLKCAGRIKVPSLTVCPTCGRTLVDVKELSDRIQLILDRTNKDIHVACMGCPVNGIGEAKDCDIGITGSGLKDLYILFSRGKEIGRYKKEEALKKIEEYIKEF